MTAPSSRLRLGQLFEIDHNAHQPFKAMEGLRGLAVTLVFLVHYVTLMGARLPQSGLSEGVSKALFAVGNSGVDLFFVLSGFLIYGSLIAKKKPFVPYFKRRIERLYPTFLTVFVIYLLLSLAFPNDSKIPHETWPALLYIVANLMLLPGIFDIEPIIRVAWSLSYELFFYLAVPLLILVLRLRDWKPSWRIGFYLLLSAVIAIATAAGNFPHVRLTLFAAGMILYELLRHSSIRMDRAGLWALVAGLVMIDLLDQSGLPGVFHFIVLFAAFLMLGLACIGQQGIAYRLFSWSPARWLGNMSYSYYLVHGLALKTAMIVVDKLLPHEANHVWLFWGVLPILFAWTLLVSAILFLAVERPFSLEKPDAGGSRYGFLHKRFDYPI